MMVAGLAALLPALATAGGAEAQVPAAEADYGGFATGTVLHTGALQSGTTRVAGVEVAQSNAAVASRGLGQQLSELQRPISLADPAHRSYGRGTGLEVGLGVDQPEPNQVILAGEAQASAAPSTDLVTEQIEVPAAPVAYSSTVRGQAQARFLPDACIVGSDLGFGLGFVEDLQLVDTGEQEGEQLGAPLVATDASGPARGVSQSMSRLRLVPQTDATGNLSGQDFGIMAETRQTIAPITLLEGTPGQITIEFLGEWVLRATATGLPGGARIHYGPGEVNPQTPILRVLDAVGEVRGILSFQDIFGPTGVSIGEVVVIGEDPRAIGGDSESSPAIAANGTSAAAAVDVLRIQLPPQSPDQSALDLRVGHMEVTARVPSGGIRCPLPVAKTSDLPSVEPGQEFTYTITVPAIPNPHACTLRDVHVVDTISVADGDVEWTVLGTAPQADAASDETVTWNDIGPIPPGEQRSVTIRIRVAESSRGGTLRDHVAVTANCPLVPAEGSTEVNTVLRGDVTVDVPDVPGTAVLPAVPVERTLAATGREQWLLALGAGLGLAAAALRRASRLTTSA